MSGNRRESTNARLVGEEPPYLDVGTEVSAKYRGAFCEASIKAVKKLVKCKVNFENGAGSGTYTDDSIDGKLKVGSDVTVKLPDGNDMVGTLVKITDSSSYTVVFDDGDERTLKRSSLCIKGEKHFNESETLDHLPLTDPENFGTPVMQQGKKSRKGQRPSLSIDDSKDSNEIPVRKKLLRSDDNEDKVVMVDFIEKKKTVHLPALLLSSTTYHCEVRSPENVLVRSFKDGKVMEVHSKDVKEFLKESVVNSHLIEGQNPCLKSAVENAIKYLDTKQLPGKWREEDLKPEEIIRNESSDQSSSSEESEEDEEQNEKEKSDFLAKLTKFLGEKGTPLHRAPVLGHRDLDLYRLFKIVSKMHGMDKVTSWHTVYQKMNIPVVTTTATYHIKNAYKRYLYDYEVYMRKNKKSPAEDDQKSKTETGKAYGKTANNAATQNLKQEEVTSLELDSEKEIKELLNEDNKTKSLRKGRCRQKLMTDHSKLLKSPNSPKSSPLSPCSPKSICSVSATESPGSSSPAESSRDLRELRCKVGPDADKLALVGDDDENVKDGLSPRNASSPGALLNNFDDGFNGKSRKELRNRASKKNSRECDDITENKEVCEEKRGNPNDESMSKDIADPDNVEKSKNVSSANQRKNDSSGNEDKIGNCKDDSREKDGDEKDVKRSTFNSDDDEGGGDDEAGGDCEIDPGDLVTQKNRQEQDGNEADDAVDVVNSPSAASEIVDSDDRDDLKPERKTKKSVKAEYAVKEGAKTHDVTGNVEGLEFKLNDRIDVRYGRGRNQTIYHAKITSVDPSADEGLYYLVHYQGWNARHDEWIGHERIIGHSAKQTRSRTIREPSKCLKPTPKHAAKPVVKPQAKKNGKNGANHCGRLLAGRNSKRTPSPTINVVTTSRSGNGRGNKNRKENINEKTVSEPTPEGKCQMRSTRRNSPEKSVETSERCSVDEEESDSKVEDGKDAVNIQENAQEAVSQHSNLSPKSDVEKNPDSSTENEEMVDVKLEESDSKESKQKVEEKSMENKCEIDENDSVDQEKSLKRTRDDETGSSCVDSGPVKKKCKEISAEVFSENYVESSAMETSTTETTHEDEQTVNEANAPDLTCSEQLPTHCVSPDPYATDYSGDDRFYKNGISHVEVGSDAKEKNSYSHVDEGKSEKSHCRKTRCRRERKSRLSSSLCSVDVSDCHNGTSSSPVSSVMLSPSWTPRYNFTEDLDELLKNEESSERIRLLQEKIKDIRKVYGELKSEVANIDRKRKRRQKRKREEELSAEENTMRSPSRSSPLATAAATTVSSSNTSAAVECR